MNTIDKLVKYRAQLHFIMGLIIVLFSGSITLRHLTEAGGALNDMAIYGKETGRWLIFLVIGLFIWLSSHIRQARASNTLNDELTKHNYNVAKIATYRTLTGSVLLLLVSTAIFKYDVSARAVLNLLVGIAIATPMFVFAYLELRDEEE